MRILPVGLTNGSLGVMTRQITESGLGPPGGPPHPKYNDAESKHHCTQAQYSAPAPQKPSWLSGGGGGQPVLSPIAPGRHWPLPPSLQPHTSMRMPIRGQSQ